MRTGDKLHEMAARFRRRPKFIGALWNGNRRICETWWTPNHGLVWFFGEASKWPHEKEPLK